MEDDQPAAPLPPVRLLTPALRIWLIIDAVLVLLSGFQLFVLTEMTEQAFAWTIAAPVSAAFLGAGYWASLYLVVGGSRQTYWSHARLSIVGVLVFTVLTTVATFMHLDAFHLQAPTAGARIAAWAWLAVYVVVPFALTRLTLLQLREPGGDPPCTAPLPSRFRYVLSAQAGVMVLLGVALFVAPLAVPWPWELTPLVGRAIAAWLIGIGVIAAMAVRENDWGRVAVAMGAYRFLGALQILVVVRYAGALAWDSAGAWLYLAFWVSVLGVGAYGRFAASLRSANGPLFQPAG